MSLSRDLNQNKKMADEANFLKVQVQVISEQSSEAHSKFARIEKEHKDRLKINIKQISDSLSAILSYASLCNSDDVEFDEKKFINYYIDLVDLLRLNESKIEPNYLSLKNHNSLILVDGTINKLKQKFGKIKFIDSKTVEVFLGITNIARQIEDFKLQENDKPILSALKVIQLEYINYYSTLNTIDFIRFSNHKFISDCLNSLSKIKPLVMEILQNCTYDKKLEDILSYKPINIKQIKEPLSDYALIRLAVDRCVNDLLEAKSENVNLHSSKPSRGGMYSPSKYAPKADETSNFTNDEDTTAEKKGRCSIS